jgi:hypothetical protein
MNIGVVNILGIIRAASIVAGSVLLTGVLTACVSSKPSVPPSASLQQADADVQVVIEREPAIEGQGPELPAAPAEPVEQPSPQTEISPVVQPEYDAEDVAWIQQRLQDLGYYQGDIDGEVGKATRNAIKQYQQDQDVESDGQPTAELREFMWRNGG